MYRPCELLHPDPHRHHRCRNEVFIARRHAAEIELKSVEDKAVRIQHTLRRCGGHFTSAPWGWRQYYDALTGNFDGELEHDSAASVQVK